MQFQQLLEKNIMKQAKGSFISSTFWSERIGYVAANETLKLMQKKSQNLIKKNGSYIQKIKTNF